LSGGFENVEKLGHLFHPKDIIDVAAGIGKAIEVKGEAVIGGLTRWTGPEGENVGHGFILSNEVLPALSSTYDPDEKAPVASPWTAWPISGADPEEKAPVAAPLATVGAEPEEKASTASPPKRVAEVGEDPEENISTPIPACRSVEAGECVAAVILRSAVMVFLPGVWLPMGEGLHVKIVLQHKFYTKKVLMLQGTPQAGA